MKSLWNWIFKIHQ